MSTSPFPVRLEVEVQFRDLDVFGHVNHATYLSYCELARVAYMRRVMAAGPRATAMELFPFIVAEATCRYLAPLFLGQAVVVQARASRVGARSFDLEYRLTDLETGRPVATARTVQVGYDHAAHASTEFPPEVRARIEALEAAALAQPAPGGSGSA